MRRSLGGKINRFILGVSSMQKNNEKWNKSHENQGILFWVSKEQHYMMVNIKCLEPPRRLAFGYTCTDSLDYVK